MDHEELQQVKAVQKWLRDAVVVFDRVTAAQQQLARLGDSNARSGIKAAELKSEVDKLEAEKSALERMVNALADGGKVPKSPLTGTEWESLLRETVQGFGGVREHIITLADFFGVKSAFRG